MTQTKTPTQVQLTRPRRAARLRIHPDTAAVLILVLLWLLFFWRIFTPAAADQTSFADSDFSGQFVTFAAYQFERLSAGELPLWNPYNNAGLPFIADTQAAALYPPRLLTIALSSISGSGWTYAALQYEVAFHVLLYTLAIYVLARRLTLSRRGTHLAGLAAAVTAGYGGYLTSYPLLQVALLEAGVWLPLALLGVLEATRGARTAARVRWPWLALTGFALGLSWLAGHPQTSWFATYLIVAYIGFQVWQARLRWTVFGLATALVGLLTLGVTAVHLLPGLEYLTRTMRTGLGFDAKSNGFVYQDISTLLLPRVFWSPLYFGVIGFGLALTALAANEARREPERVFWLGVALVALLMSFGGNSALFHALYNVLPGLNYFRGQERAVYLVVNSAALLIAYGTVTLMDYPPGAPDRPVQRGWLALAIVGGLAAVVFFVLTFAAPEQAALMVDQAFLTALVAGAGLLIVLNILNASGIWWRFALVALIVLELFSVNIDSPNTFDPLPAAQQPIMQPGPLVERALQDDTPLFRVDGGLTADRIGIPPGGNTGSLYGLHDIRGISPLFLDGPHAIVMRESPAPIAWEVFAVRYIFTDAEELPVASTIVARDYPGGDTLNLHLLDDPRPFAHLIYDYTVIAGDAFARQLLADPAFDARQTAILNQEPNGITLPDAPPDAAAVRVTRAEPESLAFTVETPADAVLTLALVDYPGWHFRVDDEPVTPIRAYGATVALPVSAGTHAITAEYRPVSFTVGAALSLFTWAGLGILGLILLLRSRQRGA
ncbi:MAG: YfhO family protein [Phototrophicaceae bacterium]